jgi:hypothetical protein
MDGSIVNEGGVSFSSSLGWCSARVVNGLASCRFWSMVFGRPAVGVIIASYSGSATYAPSRSLI